MSDYTVSLDEGDWKTLDSIHTELFKIRQLLEKFAALGACPHCHNGKRIIVCPACDGSGAVAGDDLGGGFYTAGTCLLCNGDREIVVSCVACKPELERKQNKDNHRAAPKCRR